MNVRRCGPLTDHGVPGPDPPEGHEAVADVRVGERAAEDQLAAGLGSLSQRRVLGPVQLSALGVGAIIGAGGYGQPILTGIRLNDTALILEGAIPAAVMALAIEALFHLLQNAVTPRGLRFQS